MRASVIDSEAAAFTDLRFTLTLTDPCQVTSLLALPLEQTPLASDINYTLGFSPVTKYFEIEQLLEA